MTELKRLAAHLVIPVLDLRDPSKREEAWAAAERQRDAGALAFLVFGGEWGALRERATRFRAEAPGPRPLLAADLERGVGQQVEGGRALPPLSALGACPPGVGEELAREAGEALAGEARAVGLDWIYGPVLDLADEPLNPIVGARSFAACPERVAALGAAYVEGIAAGGALACAKHFPGHGGTIQDSHEAHPQVDRSEEQLRARDLAPFRAASAAGVASVMSAHVAYPSLASERPATLEPKLLRTLLREELGFEGLVVSDALIMEGARPGGISEAEACEEALRAGCEGLLYPAEVEPCVEHLARRAAEDPDLEARVREASARMIALCAQPDPTLSDPDATRARSTRAADAIAEAALTRRGAAPSLQPGEQVSCLVLDDDAVEGLGHELLATLAQAGVVLRPASLASADLEAEEPPPGVARFDALASVGGRRVVVVGCQVRAWKGRPGLAPALAARLRALPGEGLSVVALCGPAALGDALPPGAELWLAYSDAPSCQRAAAKALLGG